MGDIFSMPGANCSIYGCGTSRKHAGIGIFRIPTKVDELSTKTRDAWVRLVTRDREIDTSLRNQIEQRTIRICERHFEKDLIEICKFISFDLAIDFEVLTLEISAYHLREYGNLILDLHIKCAAVSNLNMHD